MASVAHRYRLRFEGGDVNVRTWLYMKNLTRIPGLRIILLVAFGNTGLAIVRKDGKR